MADAISIQELIDARTDAKTLEEAVNGDAVTTVLSRLGETYPTLSNALSQIDGKLDSADAQIKQAITDLFQNGGLPATPFATKALMTASALVDGDYAMVADDTVNNGLYLKTAGAWVKSTYDPTALANTYTDNKVKGVTNNFKTKALMVTSALPDGSYAMVTEDTEANNGLYVKTAGDWVKSDYDPLTQAKAYTDTNKADTLSRVQNTFDTKALMTASPLPDGSRAFVGSDTTEDNNGFYKKTAGVWSKVVYDPLTLAKAADTALANLTNNQRYVAVASSGVSSYDADMSSNLQKIVAGRIMYNPVTRCLHIPQDTVVYKPSGGYVSLPATKIDLSAGSTLSRVYLNLTTLEFTVRRGVDSTTPAQQTTDVLFCSVRDTNTRISIDGTFPYYIGASLYGEVIQNDRLAIISSDSSSAPAPVIEVDTVAKTLTIPRDTLARYKGLNITFSSEVVIDLTTGYGAVTTALYLYFNLDTREFVLTRYNIGLSSRSDYYNCVLFCAIRSRDSTGKCYLDLSAPYMVNGEMFGIPSNKDYTVNGLTEIVKGVAHRGYSTQAPENTLPAYALAHKRGFRYVETDIRFTSDDVPVLSHDGTIDRTSTGSGDISSMTLAQVREYDFGSWKSEAYTGTKIATLEEFLNQCLRLSMHPYIELKGAEEYQCEIVVEMVNRLGMQGKVTYISTSTPILTWVRDLDPKARLGKVGQISNAEIDSLVPLKTETNEVFMNAQQATITKEMVQYAQSKGMEVEVWTINAPGAIARYAEAGVTGITTDFINVRDVLNADEYNKYILPLR